MAVVNPPSSILHRRGRIGFEFILATVKLPCDRRGAAALVYELSRKARMQSIASVVLIVLFFFAFLIIPLGALTFLPAGGLFSFFFLLIVLFFIGVGIFALWSGMSSFRLSRELKELGDAIMAGLMSEEKYCDKTVLQALYEFRGLSGKV